MSDNGLKADKAPVLATTGWESLLRTCSLKSRALAVTVCRDSMVGLAFEGMATAPGLDLIFIYLMHNGLS